MGFRKFAALAVLDAWTAQEAAAAPLRKHAHRADFDYTPRPGYLYVRSRAISSRCNDNHDEFPAPEIKAWKTFLGKPAFVNHHNANHRRARGVVIAGTIHRDRNPDGTRDTWVELLHEIDAVRFPKLAKAIVEGRVNRTSMGVDVERSTCSACGNVATSPAEYCRHIPAMKGKKIRQRNTKTGKVEESIIREICAGLNFFENSFLVEDPADPTAYVVGKPHLEKAAARTGLSLIAHFEKAAHGIGHGAEDPLSKLVHHLTGDHGLGLEGYRGALQAASEKSGIAIPSDVDSPGEGASAQDRTKGLWNVVHHIQLSQHVHKALHGGDYFQHAGEGVWHRHDYDDPLTHHKGGEAYTDKEGKPQFFDKWHPDWPGEGPVVQTHQGPLPEYYRQHEYTSREYHPERTDARPNLLAHQDPQDPDTWTNMSACSQVYRTRGRRHRPPAAKTWDNWRRL